MFVYVDDIVVIGSCKDEMQKCVNLICKEFSCRNLGELNFFLRSECMKQNEVSNIAVSLSIGQSLL